jgi:hypothetical protein
LCLFGYFVVKSVEMKIYVILDKTWGKAMQTTPKKLAQDAAYQRHTGPLRTSAIPVPDWALVPAQFIPRAEY